MTTENRSLSYLQSQIDRLSCLVVEPVSATVLSTQKELPPLKEDVSCNSMLSVGTLRREMKKRQLRQRKVPQQRIVKPQRTDFVETTNTEEIRLKYADIILNITKKHAAIDRANAALREDRSVLLVADPADDDLAASRLALRTLHAACHPGLVDPFPGTIKQRESDGVLTLTLHKKAKR